MAIIIVEILCSFLLGLLVGRRFRFRLYKKWENRWVDSPEEMRHLLKEAHSLGWEILFSHKNDASILRGTVENFTNKDAFDVCVLGVDKDSVGLSDIRGLEHLRTPMIDAMKKFGHHKFLVSDTLWIRKISK